MFINPQTAIKNGWITGLVDPDKQVQPNAIDFTADKAWRIDSTNSNLFFINEDEKLMRTRTAFDPLVETGVRRRSASCGPRDPSVEVENDRFWQIPGGGMLDFLSDVFVDIPKGVAAQLVIRSSLARNGILLMAGLYDSGFKGHVGFILHNRHFANAFIAPGTRVGQIIFVETDSSGVYSGGYNHEVGTELEYQKDGND